MSDTVPDSLEVMRADEITPDFLNGIQQRWSLYWLTTLHHRYLTGEHGRIPNGKRHQLIIAALARYRLGVADEQS